MILLPASGFSVVENDRGHLTTEGVTGNESQGGGYEAGPRDAAAKPTADCIDWIDSLDRGDVAAMSGG